LCPRTGHSACTGYGGFGAIISHRDQQPHRAALRRASTVGLLKDGRLCFANDACEKRRNDRRLKRPDSRGIVLHAFRWQTLGHPKKLVAGLPRGRRERLLYSGGWLHRHSFLAALISARTSFACNDQPLSPFTRSRSSLPTRDGAVCHLRFVLAPASVGVGVPVETFPLPGQRSSR
jgi:hypothetical protein